MTDKETQRLFDKALAATKTQRTAGATVQKRSRIPTKSEYERNELDKAIAQEKRVEKAPLQERKEAAAEFFDAMKNNPERVAQSLDMLIDGNYGKGAQMRAEQILGSPRMNRNAALTHMIGIYEWMSPGRMSVAGWKKLSPAEKKKLDEVVGKVIREADEAED